MPFDASVFARIDRKTLVLTEAEVRVDEGPSRPPMIATWVSAEVEVSLLHATGVSPQEALEKLFDASRSKLPGALPAIRAYMTEHYHYTFGAPASV